jgi:hypothetical protein
MKKRFMILAISFFLSACGGAEETAAPKVSRVEPAAGAGMSYQEFRDHHINEGDQWAAQKRFLILDRNNDGKLSPSEFNGY